MDHFSAPVPTTVCGPSLPFSPTRASNQPKGGYSTLSKHQERKTKFCPNRSLNETYNPMANETNTITNIILILKIEESQAKNGEK